MVYWGGGVYFSFWNRLKRRRKLLISPEINKLLTADGDLPGGLHRSPVPVVRVARDLPHVPGNVVDHGHHVPGHVAPDGVPVHVEGDSRQGGAHSDAEDGHGAAFGHHVDGVDRWSLKENLLVHNYRRPVS